MSVLPIDSIIGVIGAGAMGAGIAQVAAKAGHQVLLFDAMSGAAQQGIDRTEQGLKKLVQRGKIDEQECQSIISRLRPCETLEDLAPAKMIIEAIVENLDIKRKVFSSVEKICSEDAILATNTSSISVTSIGAVLSRPGNLVGMHFFNPAPVMKLVEVISGVATSPEVANIVYNTASTWGKTPVLARSTPGFIVNRVARPFYAEALRVLEEGGADVPTIDAIVRESGGYRMGPFELMDLIGHDVNYAVTNSVFNAFFQDPRFKPSLLQQELVSAGYLGIKSGRGFYNYAEDTDTPKPKTAEKKLFPKSMQVPKNLGVANPLISLAETSGITVNQSSDIEGGYIQIEGVLLALTDGRSATQRSVDDGHSNLVLFDLSLNFSDAKRVALTKSDLCSEEGLDLAIGFFQAMGKQVSILDDVPGMVLMRIVCMLANEGADAVNQQVCDAAAVDLAMQTGVNYPRGPLAWANEIGLAVVVNVLDNLAACYGEDRYRVSPLLRRKVNGRTIFLN